MATKRYPIYHVLFENGYKLSSTILRFQETYESPEFRGKAFSLEEFMDWYAERHGNFTYYQDWQEGFNIPSEILWRLLSKDFSPLSEKEKALIKLLSDKKIKGRFYIIATKENPNIITLLHEIVHGLFYIVPEYREEVKRCINRHDTRALRKVLAYNDYHPAVMTDEINAYLVTGPLREMKRAKNFNILTKRLRSIYKKHFGPLVKNGKYVPRIQFHQLKFK